jgi:hypothetical protein
MLDMNLAPKPLQTISANNSTNKFLINKISHLFRPISLGLPSNTKKKSKYFSQKATETSNYQINKYVVNKKYMRMYRL